MRDWEKTLFRKGHFGRYTIQGFRYESQGEVAWHITTRPHARNHFHEYWVSGGSFYSLNTNYTYNSTNLMMIFRVTGAANCQDCRVVSELTSQPVVDLDPVEKQTVMTAIAGWGQSSGGWHRNPEIGGSPGLGV
jgi:hypothetical protein